MRNHPGSIVALGGGRFSRAEQLRRLYRLQSTQEYRERTKRSGRGFRPLIVGTGLLLTLLGVTLFGVLAAVQGAVAGYATLTQGLPSLSTLNNRASFKTAQIFDRKGQLLWEFYDPDGGRRTVVPLSEMSQHLLDATLAAEDAYFYQHKGVDLRATLRSALLTGSGESRTGASTITQQLVRRVILDPKEAQQITLSRKAREIILAFQLDSRLTKDQILEMYLNEVYYGNQSYGVEAAAQDYFDKHARDLDIAQSALIAGLVQSPSQYDPTRRDLVRTADGIPVPTKERQKYVLEQMTRHGFITEQEARQAYAEPLQIKQRVVDLKAPHWVMYIRDLVEQKYGARELYQGGLRIYTTLDLDYSQRMQQVLQDGRANILQNNGNNAALIAVNPKTGEILAFDGSMDYNDASIDGQVNVLLSQRQPGSSIKPIVYGTAFTKGWSPGTFVNDVPSCWVDLPGHQWCPQNFDRIFHGQTTERSALGNSLNIPAIKTLEYVGVGIVREMGQQFGITTWGPDAQKSFGLSLTLGGAEVLPIDLAQLYSTFANNGLKIPLVAVTRIVDADGNVLEDYKVPQGEQVIDQRAAYMITDILKDPAAKLVTYGPNTPLVLKDRPAASKTGTTDQSRDTWTAGYTPNLAIVVWVGNTDGHPMGETLSTMTAGKIWPEAMTTSFDFLNLPREDFVRPDGLVEAQVCGDTRMRPGMPACRADLFLSENAPRAPLVSPGFAPAAPARQTAPPAPTAPVQPTSVPQQGPGPAAARPTAPPPPVVAPKPTTGPVAPPAAAPTAVPIQKPTPAPAAPPAAPKPQAPAPTPVPRR